VVRNDAVLLPADTVGNYGSRPARMREIVGRPFGQSYA